jgi:hypothetical protein
LRKIEVGRHAFAPKFSLLKIKEAFKFDPQINLNIQQIPNLTHSAFLAD